MGPGSRGRGEIGRPCGGRGGRVSLAGPAGHRVGVHERHDRRPLPDQCRGPQRGGRRHWRRGWRRVGRRLSLQPGGAQPPLPQSWPMAFRGPGPARDRLCRPTFDRGRAGGRRWRPGPRPARQWHWRRHPPLPQRRSRRIHREEGLRLVPHGLGHLDGAGRHRRRRRPRPVLHPFHRRDAPGRPHHALRPDPQGGWLGGLQDQRGIHPVPEVARTLRGPPGRQGAGTARGPRIVPQRGGRAVSGPSRTSPGPIPMPRDGRSRPIATGGWR